MGDRQPYNRQLHVERLHFAYEHVADLVQQGSKVLDLGCGTGELMTMLRGERDCRCTGIDIEEGMVRACVARGLSVFQADLDEGLREFGGNAYDYVILNQTLQQVNRPVELLREMLRVGRRAIINFPNFGYITNRVQLLFRGKMPVHRALPFEWHNTPNIHLCTHSDFHSLCRIENFRILGEIVLRHGKKTGHFMANLFSTEVCFVLEGRVEDAV